MLPFSFFREAIEMGSKYIPDLERVCVYVAQDCAGKISRRFCVTVIIN